MTGDESTAPEIETNRFKRNAPIENIDRFSIIIYYFFYIFYLLLIAIDFKDRFCSIRTHRNGCESLFERILSGKVKQASLVRAGMLTAMKRQKKRISSVENIIYIRFYNRISEQ